MVAQAPDVLLVVAFKLAPFSPVGLRAKEGGRRFSSHSASSNGGGGTGARTRPGEDPDDLPEDAFVIVLGSRVITLSRAPQIVTQITEHLLSLPTQSRRRKTLDPCHQLGMGRLARRRHLKQIRFGTSRGRLL